jgi:hypothetical protein
MSTEYNILLIDDNPYPTVECIKILSKKLQYHFKVPIEEIQIKAANELKTGEITTIHIAGNCYLYYYFYNVKKDRPENNKTILNLLIRNKINVLWMDRGHSAFIIDNDNLYETNGFTSKSEEIFEDKKIITQLIENFIQQIVIYSFNPSLKEDEIDIIKEGIVKKILSHDKKSKLLKDIASKIDFLETSPILNLYDKKLTLSAGLEPNNYLGHISAYEKYGKLLGQILYDLVLQLPEFISTLNDKDKHYNFFNKNNRQLLRYIKFLNALNDQYIKDENSPKIGLVSFSTFAFGTEYFLLDAPYKDYYEQYDKQLIERGIRKIFNPKSEKRFIHYQYFVYDENKLKYLIRHNLPEKFDKEITDFLSLLHTGIFYEPDPHSLNKPKSYELQEKDISEKFPEDAIEVYYLFNCVEVEGLTENGLLHIALYRRTSMINTKPEGTVREFWQTQYKLVEPKAKETLIPILFNQINHQAVRAAISQVMARNMSHNIGSHVLSKFKDEKEIDSSIKSLNLNPQYKENNLLNPNLSGIQLVAYFNEYLKNRMDFLADIATTDPVMETPMYLFRDIVKGFDKNRILLNRISGISDKISFSLTGRKIENEVSSIITIASSKDPLLSIPNEILGAQAFYILLENIIRNVYKHGNPKNDFEIIIEVGDYYVNKSLYEIKIFDTLNNDSEQIDKIVTSRNTAFNDLILKNNKLRENNLGTIEMNVCAAYLRCLPIVSVDDHYFHLNESNDSNNSKLIYAYKHTYNEGVQIKHSLGYKLYISKPKEVLVIDDLNEFNITGCSKDDLLNAGIEIISSYELNETCNFNQQIVYCKTQTDSVRKKLNKYKSQLPKRLISDSDKFDIRHDSIKNFLVDVWEKYFIERLKNRPANFLIQYKSNKTIISIENEKVSIADNVSPLVSSVFKILIDDHADNITDLGKYSYYDMACSHSKLAKLTTSIINKNQRIIYEYLECVITKVLIIDERIQENIIISNKTYQYKGNEILFKDYFSKQQIIIPTIEQANLNAVTFGEMSQKIDCDTPNSLNTADKIYCFIKENISDTNFCVIHLGIIEKLIPSGEIKSYEAIGKIINKLFSSSTDKQKLIITSGRGKPNNLPDDISYVQLALIQNAIETVFDKYVLNKILYNARKPV